MADGLGNGSLAEPVGGPANISLPPIPQNNESRLHTISPALLDPTNTHQAPPVLPGIDGIPYRGKAIDRKETDAPLEQHRQVHIDILDLGKPEDLKRYEQISQLHANSFGQISFEERQFLPDAKKWIVLIRWWEEYVAEKQVR